MSISLNNHEDRIRVLENAGSGSWSKFSNSVGYCLTENSTGLKIQFGTAGNDAYPTIAFPKPFTTIVSCVGFGANSDQSTSSDGCPHIRSISLTSCRLDSGSTSALYVRWIAIGILYTYRYIIKSLLIFTPLSYLFNKEV